MIIWVVTGWLLLIPCVLYVRNTGWAWVIGLYVFLLIPAAVAGPFVVISWALIHWITSQP